MHATDDHDPRREIIFLPPNHWPEPHDSQQALQGGLPRNTTLHHLAQLGAKWRVIPPTKRPWNLLDRGNPFWRGLDPLRALRVLLTCRKADAVVSVFEGNALFILLLRRLFFFKPKVILWDASPGNPWRVFQRVQKFVLPRYDGLMMLTQAQKDALESQYRLRGPVKVIGYNVDEMLFKPGRAVDPFVQSQGCVLAVGDDLSRDYDTLIEAARLSKEKFVLKTRWRPKNPSPENVTFLSERLDDDQFVKLYAKAKMVVLPLKRVQSAGGITSLFEAMAMGKPVIVSQSSISQDFVAHCHDGLIVPPDDPAALHEAVARLASDEALQRTLGSNARATIEDRFSTKQLAEKIQQFVRSVCLGRKDGSP